MNFYQAMQLDVSVCKGKIRNAANPSERHKLIAALIVKDILCVLFAVVFISILNFLFGDENSSAAVVIFCILLTVRFVDFGYCLRSSLINFFIIFVLLTFSPCIAQSVNPAWGFLINFLSIGFIVISACHEPLYGGAGLYLFAYMFLYGNPVGGHLLVLRVFEMLLGCLLCGIIFYINHRKKDYGKTFSQIVKDFSLFGPLGKWQFQVTLGLSLGILVGELLQVDRIMWVGCACLTVLSQYGERKQTGISTPGRRRGWECFIWDRIPTASGFRPLVSGNLFRIAARPLRRLSLENPSELFWRASYGYKYLWGKISNYPPYYKQHHRVLFRRPFLLCI